MSHDRRSGAGEELFDQLKERDGRRRRDERGRSDFPAATSPQPERADDREADHDAYRTEVGDPQEKKV